MPIPWPPFVLELVDLARNNTPSRRVVHRQGWPSLEPPTLSSFSYTSTLNNKFHLMWVEVKTTDDWTEPRSEMLHFSVWNDRD